MCSGRKGLNGDIDLLVFLKIPSKSLPKSSVVRNVLLIPVAVLFYEIKSIQTPLFNPLATLNSHMNLYLHLFVVVCQQYLLIAFYEEILKITKCQCREMAKLGKSLTNSHKDLSCNICHPQRKLSVALWTWSPSMGDRGTSGCLWLTGQPVSFGSKSQCQWEALSQKWGIEWSGRTLDIDQWLLCLCENTHRKMYTHINSLAQRRLEDIYVCVSLR